MTEEVYRWAGWRASLERLRGGESETSQFPAYSAMIQFGCAFYRPKAVSFDGWLQAKRKEGGDWRGVGNRLAGIQPPSFRPSAHRASEGFVREEPREDKVEQPTSRRSFNSFSFSVKRTLVQCTTCPPDPFHSTAQLLARLHVFIERHLLNVIFMHIEGTLGSLMERELERVGTSLWSLICLCMMDCVVGGWI